MDNAKKIVQHLISEEDEDYELLKDVSDDGRVPDAYDIWFDTYRPIINTVAEDDPDSIAFDGTLFETYGDEMQFVLNTDITRVWTLVQNDEDANFTITAGLSFANRTGYFITEFPWKNYEESVIVPSS